MPLLPSNYPCSSASGPLHLKTSLLTAAQVQLHRANVKLSICYGWTQTHTQFSLLDNRASYSSEDGLEDTCLSADFKLHSLETLSQEALLGSAYKHYEKCPDTLRHLPHCSFISVVYSHVLLHSPPSLKPDTQSSSNYYSQHAYVLNCYRTKTPLKISSSVKNSVRLFSLRRISIIVLCVLLQILQVFSPTTRN